MRVAALQLNSGPDPEANLASVAEQTALAAAEGARLVALPENALIMADERRRKALALEPGWAERFADLARAHRVWLLVGGIPEASGDPERPFNTALLYDPAGALAARYRKMHLFDVDLPDGTKLQESAGASAGETPVLATVDAVPMGLSICYDLRFPELYRALARAGARVLFVPSAFTVPTGQAHWHLLLRARAVENLCWVVAPAQSGAHGTGGRRTFGHTLVVDPWGQVVAERAEGVGRVLVDLDFAAQDEHRRRLPALQHARPVGDYLLRS